MIRRISLLFLLHCLSMAGYAQVTFNYTGSMQTYTVPAGVTAIGVDVVGGQGGNYPSPPATGGLGGRAQGTVAVTPGQVIFVYVGQAGTPGNGGAGGTNSGGGANGGNGGTGFGGAGGGGASDIRTVSGSNFASLNSRLLVGAGGGGSSWYCGGEFGGSGGGLTGGLGISCGNYNSSCGGPGTQTAGGNSGGGAATAGTFGAGGNGTGYGGGGGGGWYGAGGSDAGGGGACGGSSYFGGAGVTGGSTTAGFRSGNGYVTITPLDLSITPTPITGTLIVCTGSTTTLSNATSGGTWSSTNTSVATVGSTGVVSGVAAGTSTISYTVSGSSVTAVVTVNHIPAPISGASTVCLGSSTILANVTTGGNWSTSNSAIATIDPTGTATGVATGAVVMTYTLSTGCYVTKAMTVNPSPSAGSITGSSTVNAGSTITLANATTGGTWSSSNTALATVGSTGIVAGLTAGITTISYTISNACGSASATKVVTVNPALETPITFNYTGSMQTYTVPAGVTSIGVDVAGGQGGNYPSPAATGGLGGRAQGTVAVTPGQVIFVYVGQAGTPGNGGAGGTNSGGSANGGNGGTGLGGAGGGGASDIRTVSGSNFASLNSRLLVGAGGGGSSWNCGGEFGGSGGGLTGGLGISCGNYNSSCGGPGTQTAGGNSGGGAATAGTFGAGGNGTGYGGGGGGGWYGAGGSDAGGGGACGGSSYFGGAGVTGGSTTAGFRSGNGYVTITPLDLSITPTPITGTLIVCTGSTTTLSNATSGGTWSSTNTSVATVGSTGVVSGVAAGTSTISYTVSGSSVTAVVTVNHIPAPISGASTVCLGSSTILANVTTGGNWSTSNSAIATIDPTGTATGVATGAVVMTYTLFTGCYVTKAMTVNTLPSAGTITGSSALCVGSTISLTNATGGGSWSSSNTSIATVGSTGIVTGVTGGTVVISYTVANSCGIATATKALTVNAVGTNLITQDTIAACGDSTLIVSLSGMSSYSWSTGATTQNIYASNTQWYRLTASYGGCSGLDSVFVSIVKSKIQQNDTTVCTGSSIILNLIGALCSSGSGELSWSLLIPPISMPSPAIGTKNFSYDRNSRKLYQVWSNGSTNVFRMIDLNANTITNISASGWFGRLDESVFDFENNRILASRSGRDNVYAIPVTGGTWTLVGTGGTDWESFGGTYYWNRYSHRACFFGGYGYGAVKNWIWEQTGTGWINTRPNLSDCLPAKRGGGSLAAANGDYSKMFVFSGQGSCDGNQTASSCSLGSPWGNDIGQYCWLRDLWELDVATNTFTNILPVNNASISKEGAFTYDYVNGAFYIIGGFTPSASHSTNMANFGGSYTMDVKRFRRGIDAGFSSMSVSGTPPPIGTNSVGSGGAIYDSIGSRIIFIRPDGIWALNLGSSVSSNLHYAWSTGDTTASITVNPTITTTYYVTISNGISSCLDSVKVTVVPTATAGTITGASTVNAGSTITLANATTGGTWSSSTTSVATVGSTGIVAGIAAGTTTISYTVSNACGSASATKVVTVNAALETPITGTLTVCTGSTTTLSNATSGGAWSSSNTMRATVNPAGIVSGISAGTVVISYSVPGGIVTAIVTVNAAPATGTFSGSSTACVGTTFTLSNSVPGGTWSSSTDGATVGSTGIITGVAAGYAIISYTVSNECGTSVATKDVLIYAMPDAGTISGTAAVCVGTTATFTSTETGGTWSSGYAAAATVSAEGVVSGVGAGSATISYRMTNFCGTAYATQVVTVNPLPNAGTIGGANAVCEGNTITMPFISAAGSWSSSNPSVATINNSTRVVTGIAAGTTTISFTVTNSCGTATSTKVITVNPDPVAGSLSGASVLCAGTTTTITPSISGGTWVSSNPTFATVNTSGVVTGVAAGSITISYFITNGCGVAAATHALTISPAVSVGTVGGGSSVCADNTITLTNTTSGGTWSSTNTAAATVSSTGVVAGVAAGNATISYTVSNSCGTATATKAVTVNPLPVAGTISGASAMCTGTTISLSSTGTGGSWISGAPSFASISSEGVVTATAVGTVMMTYRVVNGCGTANATHPVTITTTPTVGTISGASSVCAGSNITLSNSTSGGVWSSTDAGVATIGSTGIVTGVAAGTTTISYVSTNGCGTVAVARDVTVLALPDAGTISGASSICRTATTTLSSTVAGGTWSSSYTAGASVSTTGLVTGVAAGAYTISYRMTNSCGTATATFPITILNAPAVGAIAGATTVCQAATTTLTNTAAGGAWSSTNAAAATIDANTGTATGVAAGTTTISYNVTNICGSAGAGRILTVNPLPVAAVITGALTLSAGTTTTLTATPAGGTWLSASGTIASINAAGVVTGIAAGNATISYTRANTCGSVVTTVAVTVSVATTPITGTRVVCQGATTNLANATAGGAWSTASAAIATVGATGVVTGVGAGTTTITYSFSGGGNVTATVTVNAAPAAYTGSGILCTGSTLNLGSIIPGCTWTSGTTARATVGNTTGIVTGGTTLGTVNISYVSGGCRTITQLTVNAGVGTITGTTPSPCLGNTIVLASATGGGTWSSSNTARATINATSGLLTAVGGGTVTISYTVSAGCVRTTTVTVGTPPAITGNPNLCLGQQNLLVSSGGTWSSSNTSVATIAANGFATGVSVGNAVITYRSTANAACFVTLPVTVNPLPSVIVPVALCPTQTATLTSSPAGGTWSSAFPLKASVDPASGFVTAIILNSSALSVVNITYTLPTTCSRTAIVTVNQVPAPIGGGVRNICVAGTVTLTSSTGGSTWSSASPSIAAVTAGGVVTGTSAGLVAISYANAAGCASTAEVTVNAIPGANSGTASMCRTATTTLSNAAGAGTWSSSNTSTASVAMSTGVVTGMNVGTANITYSKAAGCTSVTVVTVNGCGRADMTEDTDGDISVFTVSPNPTTGAINLTTSVAGVVVIYTIDGKEIQQYEAKAGTTGITLPAGMASGVYMLRFTGADGSSRMARLVYQQ